MLFDEYNDYVRFDNIMRCIPLEHFTVVNQTSTCAKDETIPTKCSPGQQPITGVLDHLDNQIALEFGLSAAAQLLYPHTVTGCAQNLSDMHFNGARLALLL
jgi:hypothetical protein